MTSQNYQYERIHCKYHPSAPLVEDWRAGDAICYECGLVVGDRIIDVSQEWRTFQNDTKDSSRVGAVQEKDLENFETIVVNTTDSKSKGRELRKRSTASAEQRFLKKGFQLIHEFTDRDPSIKNPVVNLAKRLLKEAFQKIKTRKNTADLAAACIFIACQKEQCPIQFKHASLISQRPVKNINNCCRQLNQSLDLLDRNQTATIANAEQLIPRFCNDLGLSFITTSCATQIAQNLKRLMLEEGKTPQTIASACIYMASQAGQVEEQMAMKSVSDFCGVAKSTTRKCYDRIKKSSRALIPVTFIMSRTHEHLAML